MKTTDVEYFEERMADMFYYHVRCGILHQAETIGESLIWSVGPLIKLKNNKMIINRIKFHNSIKKDFNKYLIELENIDNKELRRNFKMKMNYICDINSI